MKKATCFISLLLSLHIMAQVVPPPAIQWQRCLGGSNSDIFSVMKQTADGGFIIASRTNSNDGDISGNHGGNDFWLVKTDAAGNFQWRKCFGGIFHENPYDIVVADDGGYVVVGDVTSNDGDVSGNHGGADVWVIKVNAAGVLQWQRCYGGSGDEGGFSLSKTFDGGYIVGAVTSSNDGNVTGNNGSRDGWIIKLDGAGILQWQKCLGSTQAEGFTKVAQAIDGNYIVTMTTGAANGNITCNPGFEDIWMIKMNAAGSIIWQSCYGGTSWEHVRSLVPTNDGGCITAGGSASPNLPGSNGANANAGDAWVAKWDINGNLQWQRFFGGLMVDYFESVQSATDGGYIVAGTSNSRDGDICINRGLNDLFVVKLNSLGGTEWKTTYGGSNGDFASSIIPIADGSYVICWHTGSNDIDVSGNNGLVDLWLLKVAFPGIHVLPEVSIIADEISICPGKKVIFIAAPLVNQGTQPSFQWQINGINYPLDNDTLTISTLNHGDVVRCIMTSNSPCVTRLKDTSNLIMIAVDPSLTPSNFLPDTITICNDGSTAELQPAGNSRLIYGAIVPIHERSPFRNRDCIGWK